MFVCGGGEGFVCAQTGTAQAHEASAIRAVFQGMASPSGRRLPSNPIG